MNSLKLCLVIILTGFFCSKIKTQVISTNRNPVGLEHNLLFKANTRYAVTETGSAQINLDEIFNGRFAPSYSVGGPSVSNPTVILIENIPAWHVQAGSWVGWTTRYWPPSRFKIEAYDIYYSYGWVTVADYSVNQYSGFDFLVSMPAGAYTKIRFTIYQGTGTSGAFGISEFYFIHPEAAIPFEGLYNSFSNITENSGKIGVGTTDPQNQLHVNGGIRSLYNELYEQNTPIGFIGSGGSLTGGMSQFPNALSVLYDKRDFAIAGWGKTTNTWSGISLYINSDNGNVGIGSTNPQNKLDVNGTVHAKEVKIDLTGWADFVFSPTYKLRTLSELEQFVKTNKHLPEIPSASEMQQEGLSVSDMQVKLLQKVEELTLYMIELKKENEHLKSENENIKSEIQQLKEK